MVTKKASKKGGSARGYAVDRNQSIDAMVKDLQNSKERGDAFMADPGKVAREYGVKLSTEEQYAIKFVNSFSLVSSLGKLSKVGSRAVFNNNCSCGVGKPDIEV